MDGTALHGVEDAELPALADYPLLPFYSICDRSPVNGAFCIQGWALPVLGHPHSQIQKYEAHLTEHLGASYCSQVGKQDWTSYVCRKCSRQVCFIWLVLFLLW